MAERRKARKTDEAIELLFGYRLVYKSKEFAHVSHKAP